MSKRLLQTSAGFCFFLISSHVFASSLQISTSPDRVIQGDPIMITILGTSTLSGIKSITVDKKSLPLFIYDNKPTALYGFDLYKKTGTSTITVTMKNTEVVSKEITLEKVAKIEAPLGIPKSLGGNTTKSQKKLVDTLASENKSLLNLRTGKSAFWKLPFIYPVENPIVTDDYGYSRKTGSYTIAHKGTDFRAPTGTKVFAMNRGVVRIAKTYRNYGKMIVIDHGLGVMTFYVHLSKIKVTPGTVVEQGQLIGLSGSTGYAEGPHLHVSVRINDISINPVTFLGFFK